MKRLTALLIATMCLAARSLAAQDGAKSAAKSPPSAAKSDAAGPGAAKPTPSGTETKPAAPAAKPKIPELPKLETADEYISRGEELRQSGKYDQAKSDFDQALKLDPKNVAALVGRAKAYGGLKRDDDGIADCKAALKIDPKSTDALRARATIHWNSHRWDEQIPDLTEIIRLEPDDASVYNWRGAVYANKKDHAKAVDDYTKAIDLDSHSARYFGNRATDLNQLGKWDEAKADFDETIRLEPSNPARFAARGDAIAGKAAKESDETERKKQYDNAIADYSEAIRLKPSRKADESAYFTSRGWTYYLEKDYGHAMADLDQAVKLDPKSHNALNRRGLTFEALKTYDRAIEDFTVAIELDRKNRYYVENRARMNQAIKEYDKAIADYSTAIGLAPKTAYLYGFRGASYSAKRDFTSAISDYTAAIKLEPDKSFRYFDRGDAYRANLKLDQAQADYQKCVDLREAARGPKDPLLASPLVRLAYLFDEKGEDASAKPYAERALAIRQEAEGSDLGPKGKVTAQSLNCLGYIEYKMGDYATARAHLDAAMTIEQESLGPKDLQTAATLVYQSYVDSVLADYSAAREKLETALAIRKEALGLNNGDTTSALAELGTVLRHMGDYAAARPYDEQVLALRREIYGNKHPSTVASLGELALLHQLTGDYATARTQLEEVLAIRKETYGLKNPYTATAMGNLGTLLTRMKNYKEARPYLEQALAIRKESLGEHNTMTASSQASLGELLADTGDFKQARPYIDQALAIRKENLGPKHPTVALSLTDLAFLLRETGDFEESRRNYEQALAIRRDVFGQNSFYVASELEYLMLMDVMAGDWNAAETNTDKARNIIRQHVAKVLTSLSDKEQMAFLTETDEKPYHDALSLALLRKGTDAELPERSYGWLVNAKAVAQEAIAQRTLLARESGDPATIAAVKQLQEVRGRLASLTYAESKADDQDNRRKRVEELQSQENELARKVAEVPGLTTAANPWFEVPVVRKSIPADATMIDIARFNIRDFKAKGIERDESFGPPHYAAWIVPATGKGDVKIVDLGPAGKIDAAVDSVRTALSGSIKELRADAEKNKPFDHPGQEKQIKQPLDALAKLILAPLLKEIPATTKQLIVSPDASLWLVPWAALPLRDGRYAVEQYEIRYLVSGRDMVAQPNNPKFKPTAPVVFADPNYDFGPGSKSTTNVAANDASGKDSDKLRDAQAISSSVLPKVPRLPGTAAESAAIKPSLATYAKSQPTIFTDQKAQESRFKSLNRPRVLVLATHGFFLPDQNVKHSGIGGDGGSERGAAPALTVDGKPVENPLLRCGLLLAGCNTLSHTASTAADAKPTETTNDGILTGMEIVGTDLRGTDLVVLSACETGLGDVHNGEGVAGLRQAFQLAGAKSVVATLWQIPDTDSSAIITKFFDQLSAGDPKAQSLRQAQLDRIATLRQRYASAHPFFWAAFTLTGQ